jgi:hypothetical protein
MNNSRKWKRTFTDTLKLREVYLLKTSKMTVTFLTVLLMVCLMLIPFAHAATVFTTVKILGVHTCPLNQTTFVLAYYDNTNDDFSFQIYDTNGTQILAETDVDTSGGAISGGYGTEASVGVSAFNSTVFVISWYDKTDADATFAVYNTTGSKLAGPIDADADIGTGSYSVQVSCFNSTHFVIGWYDATDLDATFAVYDSVGNLLVGPIDADADVGAAGLTVSVSTFNSTTFVIGWNDYTDKDATFAIYDSAGNLLAGPVDADEDIGGLSFCVFVSTFNSTTFVIGWVDSTDQDATFTVYDSSANLKTGPTDADTTISSSMSVHVATLNSTAFVISWYDATDFDLTFATYLSDGTAVCAATDIESWPTAANAPFQFQFACGLEAGTGIKLYSDNWIIAYSNTTTQAIFKAFKPDGTTWDGLLYQWNLTVTVTDSTEKAIEGATVYLDDGLTTGTTDSTGQVIFLNVLEGTYVLTVQKRNYADYVDPIILTANTSQLVTLQGGFLTIMIWLLFCMIIAFTVYGYVDYHLEEETKRPVRIAFVAIVGVILLIVFLDLILLGFG